MEKVAPQVRWYGPANNQYTPLGTSCLPRPGLQNDTVLIAAGITGVVLQDSTVVLVDSDDYDLLRARGWTARWTSRKVTGDNIYPSINHGDKIRPIARIILEAGTDEKVRYRDGNQLNLTRSNLSLRAKGGAEINSSARRCPMAPIVSGDESVRAKARIKTKVGHASSTERKHVAQIAVREAQSNVQFAQEFVLTRGRA